MHVITGLPRSGSTLLCNILNQNPKMHASSTSSLAQLCSTMVNAWSDSPETAGDLHRDGNGTKQKLERSLRAFCDAWYQHKIDENKEIIFDKSRGWASNLLMLRAIHPDSKVIILIRDLREIFASIEKQHRKTPIFDKANNLMGKTVWGRADQMFSPDGMIGGPIEAVLDAMRRKLDVIIVRYEKFVDTPKTIMNEIYKYLGDKPFDHDFENIENTAEDLDALYLNKFPHDGSGAVTPGDPESWRNFFTEDLATTIMQRFPAYNQMFNYT